MANVCKTCRHPKRGDIEGDIVKGQALLSISANYGLTVQSLRRHTANCMGVALARAIDAELVEWGASTDERIKVWVDEARTNLQMARDNGDAAAANGAINVILKALALSAKLRGELKEGPAVSIDARSITVASDDEVLRRAYAELQAKVKP